MKEDVSQSEPASNRVVTGCVIEMACQIINVAYRFSEYACTWHVILPQRLISIV